MSTRPVFEPISSDAPWRIAPTDIAQFIRLEQCQRYLRLRLHERASGRGFLYDYGVRPQSIPAILTRSGATFERQVEQAVGQRYWKINYATDLAHLGQRPDDNERTLQQARDLPTGETVVLFQPRLDVALGAWRIRGDVDIIRLARDAEGRLHILIADMKASTTAKVEHRLQVAFYVEMLTALLAGAGIEHAAIEMAILYRGPADGDAGLSAIEIGERERQRDRAEDLFGTRDGLLEIVSDPESYRSSVHGLVTAPTSTAARVAAADFAELPYHLGYKCDGCLYNELCMKWSAEEDDLSLLPYITAEEKSALRRAGVTTVTDVAALKEARSEGNETALVAAPGKEELVRQLSATWPVGPRLDELIVRAHRYRMFKGSPEGRSGPTGIADPTEGDRNGLNRPRFPSSIYRRGYGSLPYCDAGHNPNLVRVYVDAQHDYLNDRIYMLGALVTACEGGSVAPHQRRSIVHLSDGPPDSAEKERGLFVRFVEDLVAAIVELAAPDEEGKPRAPIHLIFYNHFEQRLLLDGLARHFDAILGATPLYDFVTQLAAFDSPVATFLDQEIRELKNYPMVCQSLQAVAAYLKFDWNQPAPYRQIFRTRLFDFWGKLDKPPAGGSLWYTSRARFNSQIPLEYAYAAWGELEPSGKPDDFAPYRGATPDLLRGFHARRLEAMERITGDFAGNRQTEKRPFDLPDLATFQSKAETFAQALDEFVTIERHVDLAAWKTTRRAAPERRVLMGETLIVSYHELDQEYEIATRNRENERRRELRERYVAAWREEHPDAEKTSLPKEQRDEVKWSQEGMRFRLRLERTGLACDLDEVLGLSTFRPGDVLVLFERTTVDSRLPEADRVPFTPTPRQMLYGMRVELVGIGVERDAGGRARSAMVEVRMRDSRAGADRGFAFGTMNPRPLVDGELYTLDPDPNDWYGSQCSTVTRELCTLEATSAGGNNALYDRLTTAAALVPWPEEALTAQERFLAGLEAFAQAGYLEPFEDRQKQYIGAHGATPVLLVQGPPGTGKSYSTAFALFARLQGALAAGQDFRAFMTCKTHAATDVLLKSVIRAQDLLRELQGRAPDIFAAHIDPRLLTVPVFRMMPRGSVPAGVIPLHRKTERMPGEPLAADAIAAERHCFVAVTPGGIYRVIKDRWPKNLFGNTLCDCLVLDEASQMNLAEAVMAALPLKPDGRLVVVGDHRQMPPIVKHDWAGEQRRTFREFRTYESLFLTLLAKNPPLIQLAESFRLHADMAEFLRREVYLADGIPYFSRQRRLLPPATYADPFVAAVLRPEHTMVVIVHDEAASMMRNPFERGLIAPILEALAAAPHDLDPRHGLGVVVPHRAQRAALQDSVPALTVVDPRTGAISVSAVDTVERFQGDERTCIMVSATESDPAYLLVSEEFLLDPRRLTVALSRARSKMILVASQSVFNLFSPDEETFEHAQLWKNLLRRTCTAKLWEGDRDGHQVTVWGSVPQEHASG